MGREQGDHLPKNPVTFVRKDEDGNLKERPAWGPADEVNLRADGWVSKAENDASGEAATQKAARASVKAKDGQNKDEQTAAG